jgi:hypothetical protein
MSLSSTEAGVCAPGRSLLLQSDHYSRVPGLVDQWHRRHMCCVV